MKAIVYRKYGSPDVLQLEEVQKPNPKDDEVLVRIHAASVNSWDWDLLRGTPYIVRMWGLFRPKYRILGGDIAGTVEAIGKDVEHCQPGDEVFGDISGICWGGFAEYVCVREARLALKSTKMTFEEAAAIPQAAVLALQGLRYNGDIQKGQKVLLNGGGGGVGTFAIQIAKLYGAEVTGVDSAKKLDVMRSVGADHVIDYAQEDFTKSKKQYDLILDVVTHRSIFDCMRAVAANGAYVVAGGCMTRILQFLLMGPWISITRGKRMALLFHRPNREDLNVLRGLFDEGRVVPVIDRSYALPETAEAIRYLGEGKSQGKVVVTVSEE
jgi:NADPH:quinone reductase-like Zn-dependent oxidoreductase